MRIVLLTNVVAPDKLGGLERYVRELAEALVDAGNEVTVVAKTAGSAIPGVTRPREGLRIVRYRPPSKRNPLFALLYPIVIAGAVRRALRQAGSGAVVHGHFPVPMLPLLLGRRPYVYTMHAPVFRELLGERQGSYLLPKPLQRAAVAGLAALERRVLRRATRVITLSRFVQSEAEALAERPLPVERIPGGLDTERFSPGPRIAHPGEPVLFAARRMVERTGVELLVQAMPAVLREAPGAHLYLAGSGPRREAVEDLVAEHDLGRSVTLLGVIPDEQLVEWYRSADVCVTPTRYLEGFGLATAEAMACGAPVAVTPAGANAELVEDLPGHPAAEAVDPGALADTIVRVWRASAEPGIRDLVRARVHPTMGWPAVSAEHMAVYGAMAAAGHGR